MKKIVATMMAVGAVGLIPFSSASAYQAGDIIARGGTHYVNPSDGTDVAGVGKVAADGAWGVTGSFEYFITPNIAADLLVAVPFKHDITLNGAKVGSVNDLPPVASVVWYPTVAPTIHPYLGVGVNYTLFWNEKTTGALAGTHLSLDNSFGLAGLVGVAVDLNKSWSVVVDARYIDLDTKAKVREVGNLGSISVDPFAYGLSIGYKF
ncbi:outer membrane protein [Solimonas aquatica]|uniref:Outer membrane protein n=1 Tax=Solimonas aquatica TaxID=489703 RepID=A0A1H9HS52_9GAMM|nr:OmpW family outer membrane protein [Solimonas aquatica]SEQ65204.1 outer membrane protein [Solimonas aquatica]